MSALDKTLNYLFDGTIVQINDNDRIFKLHSYENNPIVGPIDSGLTWYEEGIIRAWTHFTAHPFAPNYQFNSARLSKTHSLMPITHSKNLNAGVLVLKGEGLELRRKGFSSNP